LNLNSIPIQLNLIQLKRNEMQIGGEGIENMALGKKT
jgi:hypothetical protein